MTTSQFDIKRTQLNVSPFADSIDAFSRDLIQFGFKLIIFRYDQHSRIVHQFNNDSLEIKLSVSEQGDKPTIVISKNDDSFFIEEFIYYNELTKKYHELISRNINLKDYSFKSLEFIKNEVMTLNDDYDFSSILGSSDFEGIINKFLSPFLKDIGFSVNREKNTDCGDNSFIYTCNDISLKLISAGRLDSGSIFFEDNSSNGLKKHNYSDLQNKLSLPNDVGEDIARWESGFYGGNYYRVVNTIKDTVKPILSYLQTK